MAATAASIHRAEVDTQADSEVGAGQLGGHVPGLAEGGVLLHGEQPSGGQLPGDPVSDADQVRFPVTPRRKLSSGMNGCSSSSGGACTATPISGTS